MVNFRSTQNALYRVVMPRYNQKTEILNLTETFVYYEGTLTPEERTPYYAAIQQALTEAKQIRIAVSLAESRRKQASEMYKQSSTAAARITSQIRNLLDAVFVDTPALAEDWGLVVRQSGRNAGQILTPRNTQERLDFLGTYIHTESERPEAEQFTHPTLAEVTAVYQDLLTQRKMRDEAKKQRMRDNARLNAICQNLAEDLRLAAGHLVSGLPNREPNRELAYWGVYVVAQSTNGSSDTETELEAAASVLEPA